MKNLFSHFCLRGVINGLQQNNLHVTISHAAMRRGGGGDISAPPQLVPLLIIAGVLVVGGLLAARAKINAVEVIRG